MVVRPLRQIISSITDPPLRFDGELHVVPKDVNAEHLTLWIYHLDLWSPSILSSFSCITSNRCPAALLELSGNLSLCVVTCVSAAVVGFSPSASLSSSSFPRSSPASSRTLQPLAGHSGVKVQQRGQRSHMACNKTQRQVS